MTLSVSVDKFSFCGSARYVTSQCEGSIWSPDLAWFLKISAGAGPTTRPATSADFGRASTICATPPLKMPHAKYAIKFALVLIHGSRSAARPCLRVAT
jgi:hypothetical protein